jgi:hypothetical protein
MKKHTQIYINHFGYDVSDFIGCEICGTKSVDIHHIESRKMGGTKSKDTIENLMALCRLCHIEYGDKKQYVQMLTEKHKEKLMQ